MKMRVPRPHRGVAEDDQRNRGVIEFFRPKDLTAETARQAITRSMPHASQRDIQARVDELMARIAGNPHKPSPPLSQSLEAVDDPRYGFGTHPEIISRLWKLDESLPQRCQWVFWGRPALVQPDTGVVFAVGYGNIGLGMRLPPDILRQAVPEQAAAVVTRNPGRAFDISPAGPEWRFVRQRAPEAAWCLAAYQFAAELAP
jgi:hypothetical protein